MPQFFQTNTGASHADVSNLYVHVKLVWLGALRRHPTPAWLQVETCYRIQQCNQ